MDFLNFSDTEICLQNYECADTLNVPHFCIVLLLQAVQHAIMLQWSNRNMPIYIWGHFFSCLDKRLPKTLLELHHTLIVRRFNSLRK